MIEMVRQASISKAVIGPASNGCLSNGSDVQTRAPQPRRQLLSERDITSTRMSLFRARRGWLEANASGCECHERDPSIMEYSRSFHVLISMLPQNISMLPRPCCRETLKAHAATCRPRYLGSPVLLGEPVPPAPRGVVGQQTGASVASSPEA